MVHRQATIAQATQGGAGGASPAAGHSLLWRNVNIPPVERRGRIGVGLAAIVAGVVLLTGAGSFVAVVLEVLLIVAGLDRSTSPAGTTPARRGYLTLRPATATAAFAAG